MDLIRDDQFKTFVPSRPTEAEPLDMNGLMLAVSKQFNFALKDFWDMPLFLVMELLGFFIPPAKKAMSRKTLIDHEKKFNRRVNGY